MTFLPDIDQGSFDAYQLDEFNRQAQRKLDSFGADRMMGDRIADLQSLAGGAEQAPPPSPDQVGPAAEPAPPSNVPSEQTQAPEPSPVPPAPAADSPAQAPESSDWATQAFGGALAAVSRAGGDVQRFAQEMGDSLGTTDQDTFIGQAMGAASRAGTDMQRFASGLQLPEPPRAPTSTSTTGDTTFAPTTAEISGGGPAAKGLTDRARMIMSDAANAAGWLGDQGQKALQAVLVTEGGMNNARGDSGSSAGPLQFFGEEGGRSGQLNAFAASKGMSLKEARDYIDNNPTEAVRWAVGSSDRPGYLGRAIADGMSQGLTGADLATYAQRRGQVSVSPERAGQNWMNLFGQGASAVSGAASAVGGAVNDAANTDWLGLAKDQLNKPYIWGSGSGAGGRGSGDIDPQTGLPKGFDCSGYVSWVLKEGLGVDLPAFTGSAYDKTKAISADQARPGDVVFYNMDQGDPHVQHMALYIGNGQIIQAGGTARNVNIASVNAVGTPEFRRAAGTDAADMRTTVGATLQGAASTLGDTASSLGDSVSSLYKASEDRFQQGRAATDQALQDMGVGAALDQHRQTLSDSLASNDNSVQVAGVQSDASMSPGVAETQPAEQDADPVRRFGQQLTDSIVGLIGHITGQPAQGGGGGAGGFSNETAPQSSNPSLMDNIGSTVRNAADVVGGAVNPSEETLAARRATLDDPNNPIAQRAAAMDAAGPATAPEVTPGYVAGGAAQALLGEPFGQLDVGAGLGAAGRELERQRDESLGVGKSLQDRLLDATTYIPGGAADLGGVVSAGLRGAGVEGGVETPIGTIGGPEVTGLIANLLVPAGAESRFGEGPLRTFTAAERAGRRAAADPALVDTAIDAARRGVGALAENAGPLLRSRQRAEAELGFATGGLARAADRTRPDAPLAAVADPALRGVAEDADRILEQRRAVRSGAVPTDPTPDDVRQVFNGMVQAQENLTDRRARLQALENHIERSRGEPLNLDERAWIRARVYEGRADAAWSWLQEEISPSLRQVARGDLIHLDAFLEQMDNVDKAASIGRRVESRILDTDLGTLPGTAAVSDAEQRVRNLERQVVRAGTAADPEVERMLRRRLDTWNRVLERRRAALDSTTEAARAEQARIAGTEGGRAADRRQFSGGARAQDPEQVQQMWRERLGGDRADTIFNAADAIWGMNSQLRELGVRSGVLGADQADFLERNFPHYISTQILERMSDQAIDALPAGGKTFSVGSNGIKQLSEAGTELARRSPLSSFVDTAFRFNELAERNGIMRRVAGWADEPAAQNFLRRLGPEEEVPRGFTVKSFMDGDNGKQRIAVVNELLPALDLTPGQSGLLGTTLKAASAPLRIGATAARPAFVAFNMANDALWSLYRHAVLSSDPAEYMRAIGDFARGYAAEFGLDPELAQRARRAGASIEMQSRFQNPDDLVRQLAGEHVWVRQIRTGDGLKQLLRDSWGATGDVAGMVWTRPIGALARPLERAPRTGFYARAERLGQSPLEAAQAYRSSTADFAAGGLFTKQLNNLIPFLNATMQASAEAGALTRRAPWRSLIAQGTILSAIIGTEIYNRAVAGDDYKDVTKYTLYHGMVVMSDKPGEGGGKRGLVFIPLRGLPGALVPLTREIMGRIYGDSPRAWQDLAKETLSTLSPLDPDLGAITALAPPPARLTMELATNHDLFRDQPIVPTNLERLPPSEQYTPTTSQTARVLARSNAPFVGGKPAAAIDYAIRSASPGPGEALLGFTDALLAATGTGPARPPSDRGPAGARDVPLLGGVAGRFLRTAGEEQRTEKYAASDALVEESRPAAMKALEGSKAYQGATLDRQRQMLAALETELQNQARQTMNLDPKARDLGLPPKYPGVKDPQKEQAVDEAISKYRAWLSAFDRGDKSVPKPNKEEMQLAALYEGLINPDYTDAKKAQQTQTSDVQRMAREAVSAKKR